MPREIYLVKVGMTMTEGVVDEWYIADGGAVNKGDLLYRLETEKVQLEVDAEADGIVRHLVPAGVTCEPGDVVGYIYAAGEEIPDVLPQPAGAAAAAPVAAADASPASAPATVTRAPGERVRASPAARRLARELGVDYTLLAGTGPGGRIVEADVQAAHDAGGVPAAAAAGDAPRASPLAKRLAAQYALDLASIRGTGPGGRITREDVENAAALFVSLAVVHVRRASRPKAARRRVLPRRPVLPAPRPATPSRCAACARPLPTACTSRCRTWRS